MKYLGYSNEWHDDSLEKLLVDMTKRAGFHFEEIQLTNSVVRYVCEDARLCYNTYCQQ